MTQRFLLSVALFEKSESLWVCPTNGDFFFLFNFKSITLLPSQKYFKYKKIHNILSLVGDLDG
jgi:hypothetical protein